VPSSEWTDTFEVTSLTAAPESGQVSGTALQLLLPHNAIPIE